MEMKYICLFIGARLSYDSGALGYLEPEEKRQQKKLRDILGLGIIYVNY